jgi:hypothetical protein
MDTIYDCMNEMGVHYYYLGLLNGNGIQFKKI